MLPENPLSSMSWSKAKKLKYSRRDWIAANAHHNSDGKVKKITNAIKSVIKTTILRKDRTTDEEYTARLLTCDSCKHAVKKNNKLYTCGPMLKSLTDANLKTCGCILTKKARDKDQDCPFGYWPTINKT